MLNFHVENIENLVRLMEELTDLRVDLDAAFSSSSVKISVYGSPEETKNICEKIEKLVEETKLS